MNATIPPPEALDALERSYASNLVQIGENVREHPAFICNCCGCCCEALVGARRVGWGNAVATTNYLPQVNEAVCNGCGKCVTACPVEAMSLVSTNDPQRPKMKKARVNTELCLGCGVCVPSCGRDGLRLQARPARVLTPVDSAHRIVLDAIEQGKLANLIFDQQTPNHRVLAAILGAILRMPPLKQALANKQLQSRYLVTLLAWSQNHLTHDTPIHA